MKIAIGFLSVLLLLQVIVHVLLYAVNGFSAGFSGLGAVLDADLVRLTVGLIGLYIARK